MVILAVLVGGCLPESEISSLSPFYTSENRVTNDNLIGKWGVIDDDEDEIIALWTFKRRRTKGRFEGDLRGGKLRIHGLLF
jgi:hypothetical protein